MDERSLRVLRSRRDIACVLVNPLQALHPNAGRASRFDAGGRPPAAGFDRAAYTGGCNGCARYVQPGALC